MALQQDRLAVLRFHLEAALSYLTALQELERLERLKAEIDSGKPGEWTPQQLAVIPEGLAKDLEKTNGDGEETEPQQGMSDVRISCGPRLATGGDED